MYKYLNVHTCESANLLIILFTNLSNYLHCDIIFVPIVFWVPHKPGGGGDFPLYPRPGRPCMHVFSS